MATSLLSFTLIPAYTVPNPPFPKTSPTLYASSNTVFLLFFKYFFTESSLIFLLLHCWHCIVSVNVVLVHIVAITPLLCYSV